MSRQLGITQINMYVDMVTAEFAPVIAILEGRTEGVKPYIGEQVKKEFGIYELLAERAALEERIRQIENLTESYTKKNYDIQVGGYRCKLDAEVEKRIELLNRPLAETKATRDAIIKQIKLASAVPEVKSMFEEIGNEVTRLAEKAKSLPPIEKEMKQISSNGGRNSRNRKGREN